MPLPIPAHVFEGFHTNRSLLWQDKAGYATSLGITLLAIYWSCTLHSPMPLVGAFCFCALTIATLDDNAA
jgi:hypothetical protein